MRMGRLFETVRHLKGRQIFYQLYYRLVRRKPEASVAAQRRARELSLSFPAWRLPSTVDGKSFTLLGESRIVAQKSDWNSPEYSKLWLYNLHYLDDLDAKSSHDRTALLSSLVDRWIDKNPSGCGNGWEPYPTSLRVVNLVKWFTSRPEVSDRWLASLACQAETLSKRIEYHILGNHLFANGKALVFAGVYLGGDRADAWLKKGLEILDLEMPEQFLSDGMHFELSPMYHATLLWDMCDLVNIAENAHNPELMRRLTRWRQVIQRGLAWFQSMLHPDGGIPFFNDASFGIAPTYADVKGYADHLSIGLPEEDLFGGDQPSAVFHPDSGYAAISMSKGDKALVDLARVGPDYQPGHAHADTLSFELSIHGQRVFVNSGTSQYGDGPERQRQRSTAAHNTVEIDGFDSSEVWAGFRVARRALPTVECFEQAGRSVCIRASHNGYRRLKGKNIHSRQWNIKAGEMMVTDAITGSYGVAVSRLHIHPDVAARCDDNRVSLNLPTGETLELEVTGADSIRLTPSTWHPEFGQVVPNHCIESSFSKGSLSTLMRWKCEH